jgi:hypothetical protein
MRPHSKTLAQLCVMAELFYQEIRDSLENAVSFDDLYQLRTFKAPKGRQDLTIDKVVKRSEFYEKLRQSCIKSQQINMPENNEALRGMYIFSIDGNPVYIGISRNVFNRLKQHAFGATHFSASLAYRIHKGEQSYEGLRKDLKFEERQIQMRNEFRVNVIPVADPYELYWLEVTLAGMFGMKYNEFETH